MGRKDPWIAPFEGDRKARGVGVHLRFQGNDF